MTTKNGEVQTIISQLKTNLGELNGLIQTSKVLCNQLQSLHCPLSVSVWSIFAAFARDLYTLKGEFDQYLVEIREINSKEHNE